jgi:DNA-binding NtrC family response regulator
MSSSKKWNLLYIEEKNSQFDSHHPDLAKLFNKVDHVSGKDEALKLIKTGDYDIIINDVSQEPLEGIILFKRMKDENLTTCTFAMVDPKDEDKLYMIADLGVNAFELIPEHFSMALEQIAEFDPYAKDQ